MNINLDTLSFSELIELQTQVDRKLYFMKADNIKNMPRPTQDELDPYKKVLIVGEHDVVLKQRSKSIQSYMNRTGWDFGNSEMILNFYSE